VALVEGGRPVVELPSETEGAHGEHLLPLVERAFQTAGWERGSIDRVGVGVGPGSFTGIRVGIALATGIGLGLGRPVVGVGSLAAIARAVPGETPGLRCVAVDARRGELFVAVFTESCEERVAPVAVPRGELAAWLDVHAPGPRILAGEALRGLVPEGSLESPMTELPHAVSVAWIAESAVPEDAPPEPRYVRPPDAVPTALRSPLSSGTR